MMFSTLKPGQGKNLPLKTLPAFGGGQIWDAESGSDGAAGSGSRTRENAGNT